MKKMSEIMEMIVKSGKNFLVKDSSGQKILGKHPNKKSAMKQLAAIEISKKKRKGGRR
jgi:hypothetical protein